MIAYQWPYALAALLFAAGMWLLLPRGGRSGRRVGAGLTVAGLALLTLLVNLGLVVHNQSPYIAWSASLPQGEGWVFDGVFLALAAVTVGSAVAAVTLRSPVYCALWFALTLLGTAGLFLYQGAQFLGVATIVVYAGAILVTFLFVLMLAQPQGDAYYDRVSWEAMLSAIAGAVMIGMITMTVTTAFARPGRLLSEHAASRLAVSRDRDILNPEHVATLGSQLFSTHLISVEVAGTLLLVALVGAVAIVAQEKKPAAAVVRPLPATGSTAIALREGRSMGELTLLYNYLIVGALLFGIGLIGFLSRRNMIIMFLAAEMMLQGISVSLVAWGRFHNDWGGQILVIFILTVAACEAGIALALILMLFHRTGNLDIAVWQNIRETNQPKFVDQELPADLEEKHVWPHLTPSGVEPAAPEEKEMVSRSHV